jgi:DNA-binding MarR family transcriptional regulator
MTIIRTISVLAAQHDLSARQLVVFSEVYGTDELLSVKHLTERLGFPSKAIVTRALDKLCGHKLVQRHADPHDRRMIQIHRTPEGTKYYAALEDVVRAAIPAEAVERLAA